MVQLCKMIVPSVAPTRSWTASTSLFGNTTSLAQNKFSKTNLLFNISNNTNGTIMYHHCAKVYLIRRRWPLLRVFLERLQTLLLSHFQKQTHFIIFKILQMTLPLWQMIVPSVLITRLLTVFTRKFGKAANLAEKQLSETKSIFVYFIYYKWYHYLRCLFQVLLLRGLWPRPSVCLAKLKVWL